MQVARPLPWRSRQYNAGGKLESHQLLVSSPWYCTMLSELSAAVLLPALTRKSGIATAELAAAKAFRNLKG